MLITLERLQEIRNEADTHYKSMQEIVNNGAEGWEQTLAEKEGLYKSSKTRYEMARKMYEEGELADIPQKQPLKSLPTPQGAADQEPLDASNKMFTVAPLISAIKAIRDKDSDALKTLQLTNSPHGGWMLPEHMVAEILPVLKPALVFDKLRCRMIPMVDDNVTIRKRVGRGSVYWQGESQTIGTTTYRGGQLKMTAKYAAAIIEISNRLLNSSQGALVEASARQELIEELQLAFEYAYLYGSGAVPAGAGNTGAQPRGLSLIAEINNFAIGAGLDGSTGAKVDGDIPSLQDFNFAMNMVERANIPMRGTMAWLAHPVVKARLRQLVDEDGRHYFWEDPSGNPGKVDALMGYPVHYSTQIPTTQTVGASTDCTEMFFGEWAHFNIGTPANIRLDANAMSDSAYTADETHLRAITSTDCEPSYPEAFVQITGIRGVPA